MPGAVLIWSIAIAAIACILVRPRGWPEAVWACLGAGLLIVLRLLPVRAAWQAAEKGADVYLFLAGMMLLAELARREGVFDWLAGHAVEAARGSRARLFTLIYLVGILVTVFLSNDATAVVLTPAVYAAVRKARAEALPYLLSCAFIANAASFVLPISNPANLVVYGKQLPHLAEWKWASFVLPISNPANLVVYGKQLPHLAEWLRIFLLPSVFSIGVTFLVLRWISADDLAGKIQSLAEVPRLSTEGRRAAWGIAAGGAVLVTASGLGWDLGVPTFCAAVIVVLLVTRARSRTIGSLVRGVSWSVLPLVAGLFILVEGLNRAGAQHLIEQAIRSCSRLPMLSGSLCAAFGVAFLSNVMNNLPSGLLTGSALQGMAAPESIRHALLIGVDLGPNLSVTGSLATILWLIAIRREGEHVSAGTFFKVGVLVMPPALLTAAAALALVTR